VFSARHFLLYDYFIIFIPACKVIFQIPRSDGLDFTFSLKFPKKLFWTKHPVCECDILKACDISKNEGGFIKYGHEATHL